MKQHARDMDRIMALHSLVKDRPRVANARIIAAIYIKNELVSIGFNQHKTSPMAVRYAKNPNAECIHAEVDAIHRAALTFTGPLSKRNELLKKQKTTLYVVRSKAVDYNHRASIWGNAMPCNGCMKAIKDFNINRVVYTMDEDVIGKVFGEFTNG